jgi:hypothetical protein
MREKFRYMERMTLMSNHLTSLLMVLAVTAGMLASCVPVPTEMPAAEQAAVAATQQTEATTAPTTIATATVAATATATATPTSTARVQPTATSSPSDTPAPTSTASPRPAVRSTDTPQPTSTVAPTSTEAPQPTEAPAAAAAANPNLVVITEDDIAKAVAEGAGAQQGATIENLNVRFADDKMTVTAGKIGYGLINLQNLNLVGRLVAKDGVLSLEVESISPRGLVSNFIPTMANQALAQYGANWYVEDVQILDGRVELRIR